MADEEATGVRRRGKASSPRMAAEEREKTEGAKVQSEIKSADGKENVAKQIDFSAPLQKALGFMEKEQFAEAAKVLETTLNGLAKEEKDAACLHNLGVCYTELGAFLEAEEAFWDAFERAPKDSDQVFKTMYGLASALTTQDDACKLLQGEALLRDVLDKGMQREGMVEDLYRSFVLLAENLGRQKKWSAASQAWESSVAMGGNMFGEDHEMVERHRMSLARAQKLARWQGRLRIVTWSFCIAIPCFAAYYVYGKYWVQPDSPQGALAEASSIPQGL